MWGEWYSRLCRPPEVGCQSDRRSGCVRRGTYSCGTACVSFAKAAPHDGSKVHSVSTSLSRVLACLPVCLCNGLSVLCNCHPPPPPRSFHSPIRTFTGRQHDGVGLLKTFFSNTHPRTSLCRLNSYLMHCMPLGLVEVFASVWWCGQLDAPCPLPRLSLSHLCAVRA